MEIASTFVWQTIIQFKVTLDVEAGRCVKAGPMLDGVATCSPATSGTDNIIGIAVQNGQGGDMVDIQIGGLCINARIGGSIPLGSLVTSGSDGRLVQAQSGDRAIGVLIGSSDIDGDATADSLGVVMINIGGRA